VAGFLFAWLFFSFRPGIARSLKRWFRPIFQFSFYGWYFDAIYEYGVVDTVTFASRITAWADRRILDGAVNLAGRVTVVFSRIIGWFDRYVVDGIVTLVGATVQFLGLMARSVQTGRIQAYLTWVVAAVVVIFFVLRFALSNFP